MSVIVVTSATGSPGATTTALGFALTWPRDVLLVDADREPAQSIQAGYLRGADHGGRGLTALVRLHRENRPFGPELHTQSLPLTAEEPDRRRFLPGFTQPGVVRLFDGVWPELASTLAGLDDRGVDVIVDAGSVGPDGLPLALLAESSTVLFVTRTGLRSLASARLYLPLVRDQLDSLPVSRTLGLVLIGPGRPYGAREISGAFGVDVVAELPWHEKHAAVLSDGADEPRRFADTTLMHQMRAAATRLQENLQEQSLARTFLTRGWEHA